MNPRVILERFGLVLALLASGATRVHAQGLSELERQLAMEPARVTTPAGRVFSGLLDGWRDGRLHLRAARDGGEIGYSFAAGEISRLDLPGAEMEARAMELWERGETAGALPLLDAIARQRMRYLPVLDEAQRRPLIACVLAQLRSGVPLVVLGYAERLLPLALSRGERASLLDARLLATVQLDLKTEALRLALEWCQEERTPGRSALGWSVLARLAYDEGNDERALWLALQPVVLAGQPPAPHLDTCYTLAVCAAHRLGSRDHAGALFRDARERGLAWVGDEAFAAVRPVYEKMPMDPAAIQGETPSGEPAPRRPAADPRRTLEETRKLIGPPAS